MSKRHSASAATDHVVVVGAGPAGARCAERLAGCGMSVTLIGAEPWWPYNRVGLSKWLAGSATEAEMITHDASGIAALGLRYRAGTWITAIDRAQRALQAHDGTRISYDRLVLALGSHAVRLDLPGANLPGVLLYRTAEDVRHMLAAAAGGGQAVVIGGGLLGLEAAAGLAARGMAVTVVHAEDRLMERQLDDLAGGLLAARLDRLGIACILNARTVAVEGQQRASAVKLSDGTHLPADLVVMAVGIRPETALARQAGLHTERGIVVDDAMQTSDPAICAIGECAQHRGVCCGMVAPALAHAEAAAASILGMDDPYRPAADAAALKVAGAGVWSAGEIGSACSVETITWHDNGAEHYRKLVVRDRRLVGALLFGETSDAPFYFDLIARGHEISTQRDVLAFGPAFASSVA